MANVKLTQPLLEKALELQRLSWTTRQIAQALGVHRNTVSRALSRINARAYERLVEKTAEIKARQIFQLEWVAQEAALAWERSKAPGKSVKIRTLAGASPEDGDEVNIREVTRESRRRDGDPRFLGEVRAALTETRRILGIEKSDGTPQFDLAKLTAEAEAEALRDIADEETRSLPPGR